MVGEKIGKFGKSRAIRQNFPCQIFLVMLFKNSYSAKEPKNNVKIMAYVTKHADFLQCISYHLIVSAPNFSEQALIIFNL